MLLVAGCQSVPGSAQPAGAAVDSGSIAADAGQPPGTPAGAGGPPAGSDVVEPAVVKGRVTTAAGEPLAGVSVLADNTLMYDSNLLTTTDADGRYRIELPAEFTTTWTMYSSLSKTFHDQHYEIELAVDKAPFSTSEGAVRDIVWKLSGIYDESLDLGYGETAFVYQDYNTYDIDNMADVELTFTPTGPMIDGSTMEPFHRRAEGGQIDDLPIGPYSVSARYLPEGGQAKDLLIKLDGVDSAEYGASADGIPAGEQERTLGFVVRLPDL